MTKRLIKPCIVAILTLIARAVIGRYRPKVIMVTGSVGKTSTKDAIVTALSPHRLVRGSEKSFNSEFGVPFTVLGVGNPWSNVFAWGRVMKSAFVLLTLPNRYPALLVLEVGADKPGDLKRILRIARPDVVVVTHLPEIPVHVEFYASPEAVREEEFSPAYALPPGAPLIVSADDPYAPLMASRVPASLTTYGLAASASVRLSDITWHEESGVVTGTEAILHIGTERVSLVVKGSAGKTQLLPVAAAVATAIALGISFPDALAALEDYEPPAGRGRLFRGANDSTIIDDSYNSSPAALEEALATLASFPTKGRRIAVLGDMLELGRYSVAEHERIGRHVASVADLLVTVGIRAKGFASSALSAGMGEEHIHSFSDASAAAAALVPLIKKEDVTLVKGSQSGIRLERLVEQLLANPGDKTRLVRQDKQWQER